MNTYSILKDNVQQINNGILVLFSAAKSIPGMSDYSFGSWEKTCEGLPGQLAEDIIRVAIVGPIKSGKSTFLNSIFKGDYVKRGAGVVTSIVTRVRNGERLRAKLYFKSWDEVNADIDQALVLFPSLNWRSESSKFDIRQEKERYELQRALSELSTDHLITQDTRNINNVLLTSYLKGYDSVINHLSPENAIQVFEHDQFADHKAFVGDESLAVYLKDILLEINSSDVQSNIEIADCQGSDSSNPLHLAMIQDYLLLTHLIVYVVSSRTGLRRADIRFLSMIKKMGILENILFVINCDFSEHESLADLKSLEMRVREELAMIKQAPDIYTFSALYNLFSSQNDNLSGKDRLRFEQWTADRDLADFSKRETVRFDSNFNNSLASKRSSLLLNNHVERLGVILNGISDWVGLNRDVLTRDADSAAELIEKIRSHQQRLNQIKSSIKNTLAGGIPEIKQELNFEVNRFFEPHSDNIVKDIGSFISGYTISPNKYKEILNQAGFSQTLYQVFQEFKQSVDTFITEVVNPEVIRFIHTKENRIREYFESLVVPFNTMIEDAYEEYIGLSNRTRFVSNSRALSTTHPPEMDPISKESDLKRPPLVATMHYSVRTKTEAIMRLGFYRALRNIKTLFKKSSNAKGEEALRALKDGVRRMKLEIKKSVVFHLKDYQENLKFGYFYKLIEATSDSFAQASLDRFQAYFSDLSTTIEHLGTSQFDKEKATKIFNKMDKISRQLTEKLNRIKSGIESPR